MVLKEIKFWLFEGQDNNLVHIKDVTKGTLFRVAGMIIAHSILQGCPQGLLSYSGGALL